MRAEEFVGGAHQKIAIERGHVDESVRAVVDGVNVGEGSGLVGEATISFTGLMVPTALEAYPAATSLVLEFIFAARSAMSSVQSSSWISAQRTVTPRSSAICSHGETLAS